MREKSVLIQKKKKICTLILNRPKLMNALHVETVLTLHDAFTRIASDRSTRVVILEGAGTHFSSGGDLNYFKKVQGTLNWLNFMQCIGRLTRTMRELPQLIVCKVRGVAIGGGANLALAGDFVLAAHDARFCQVFANIGLVLDSGGTFFLPRLIGMVKARELAYMGETIDGKTARRIGLIYKSVPDEDLDRETEQLAGILLKKFTPAHALIKQGLEKSFNMSLSDVLEWESAHQAVLAQTPDHKKALAKFLDPKTKGKNR